MCYYIVKSNNYLRHIIGAGRFKTYSYIFDKACRIHSLSKVAEVRL